MELNSPRKDPYSSMSRAEKGLEDEGYNHHFEVMDLNEMKDEHGQRYQPDEVQIDQIIRLPEKQLVMSGDKYPREPKAIYAINTKKGTKGILKENMNDAGGEVVEAFLRRVDRNDQLKESYTS